ncbi:MULTISPECIES: hypothetical protein [unclassified Caballeronia]|uniref:hypothetical protein n=1 Tax=unclassified Caballeronia TaxID=2646786 RepID=UPI001F416650|nr:MULTISPECIES: hypothetical protein [unclassified Caballeronia]MCE4544320.1 hypothetical protein [Caballeronia sp. PC1]MCE4571472.1 hypothetical protein [Caballeronia sp. CLC5]
MDPLDGMGRTRDASGRYENGCKGIALMKNDVAYLTKLLDQTAEKPWTEKLRTMFASDSFMEKADNPQSCIVSFALNQANRRLKYTQTIGKETFGIDELIAVLSTLDQRKELEFFSIENSKYLGTCYIADERMLGCECVLKTGTVSKPGLWIDGKQIN